MAVDVLVIEPDALQRDLIVLALQRVRLQTFVSQDTQEVSRLLLEHKPALLILDLYLPDRSGLDLLEELRQAGLLVLTRVIIVSSLTFPDVVKRATRLGATAFLAKPIDADLLLERVQQILNKRDRG